MNIPKPTIKAFVGDYEIIGSGTNAVQDDFPLQVQIENLIFYFIFSTDKSNKNTLSNIEVIDNNSLLIKLINFNNSMGAGTLIPWHVGYLYNRNLYLTYWIWSVDVKTGKKVINWSFMLDDKNINHG